MIEFWLVVSVLLGIACFLVVVPALSYSRVSGDAAQQNDAIYTEQRIKENIAIYKERLAEIDSDLRADLITQADYNSLKAELENTLLDDAQPSQNTELAAGVVKKEAERQNTRTFSGPLAAGVLGTVAMVLAVSFFTYAEYGAYDEVVNANSVSKINDATAKAKQGDISDLLQQLHAKLLESPDNIQGWSLLARSAMSTERYGLAIEAFENIIRILKQNKSDDSELGSAYGVLAQALYYRDKGVMSPAVTSAIGEALSLNPKELNALGLLAIEAFTREDYRFALDKWQTILETDPNHPAQASIKAGIQESKKRLGIPEIKTQGAQAEVMTPQLFVQVSADAEMLKELEPSTALFVFVKNAESGTGPDIPLAASRHLISDLPLTITLDDRNSMGPMAKLSDAKVVNVFARVSPSGNPVSQPGDIEGKVENVLLSSNTSIAITIDTVLN